MAAANVEGLALAFELAQFGVALQAHKYRRQHPQATDQDVTAYVQDWLLERRGAPFGDAIGRSIDFPR